MERSSNTDENGSIEQVMFTNLLLLGLDVEDMECVYKIPFNKDMFNGYNKPGANSVLHFLFYNLNPTISDEQFRDCWPIVDKKSEAQFRRTCFNWLVTIKKAETDVRWPVLNASSLQFPGGPKFIQILFRLSTHVLRQGIPDQGQQYLLVNPSQSTAPPDMAAVKLASICDNTYLDMQKFMNQMYITNSAHQMWNKYASELVHGIREMSKAEREMEQEKRQVVTALAENAIKQGCTLPMKRTLNMFDGNKDDAHIKQQYRLKRVNASWQKVESFYRGLEDSRDIVKAVLEHSSSSERLDSNDIGIRIPGLLLKQCEKEIRQQQIDNVYIGGRLNLVSVLQLWNLCLRLYLEQLEEAGLPDVTKDVPALTMQAHKFHSFLKEIQALREDISSVFIPELEDSIQNIRQELNRMDEKGDTGQLSKSSLQLLTPTLPTSSLHKSHSNAATPVGLISPKTADKKDTPTVLSEMMASILNGTHKTQTVQPSRLVFNQLKTSQRSFPSTPTYSKNSKQTHIGKIKRETVSIPTKKTSGKTVKGINQESRLSESKPTNNSHSAERESSIGILDQMVHSVVNSVIDRHDTDDFWGVGHRISSDASLNDDLKNAPSFSQALMLELDQDSASEVNVTLEDSFAPLKYGILLDKSPMKSEPNPTLESTMRPLDSPLNMNDMPPLKSPVSKYPTASVDSPWSTNPVSSFASLTKSPMSSLNHSLDMNSVSTLKSPASLPRSPIVSLDSSFNGNSISTTKSPFNMTPIENFKRHHRSELKTNPPHFPSSFAWDIQQQVDQQVDDLFSQTCRIFEDIDDD